MNYTASDEKVLTAPLEVLQEFSVALAARRANLGEQVKGRMVSAGNSQKGKVSSVGQSQITVNLEGASGGRKTMPLSARTSRQLLAGDTTRK